MPNDPETVQLRGSDAMRIGVVADTHSEPNPAGLWHLAALKPDLIFHAGDIGAPSVLERLSQLAPVRAVRGNIDVAMSGLPEARVLAFERDGQRALTVLLTHVAVDGVRIRGSVARRARAAQAGLIVCGHSHVPFVTREYGITLFNPGSIGPRRPGLPILFGVLEISATGVSLHHVDAETGARWLPPP